MPKSFTDYEPGFVHVDIKYLPQMPDEASRRYLFVAIDRAHALGVKKPDLFKMRMYEQAGLDR